MLGKLAKWLRVLGHDTHYQSYYQEGDIERLVKEGRYLLSRHKKRSERYRSAILINSNHVGVQLAELNKKVCLAPDQSNWFGRCLICNTLLKESRMAEARENVPEYIYYQNVTALRFCPSCGRYYWPGSHRKRMMMMQLEAWDFPKADRSSQDS